MKAGYYRRILVEKAAVLFAVVLFTSCTSTKQFQRSLEHKIVPLGYLFDSQIKECDNVATIAITQFDDAALLPVTTAKKKGGFVIPLLFLNYWEVNFNTTLGKASLNQDFSQFFKSSFKIESERSGCYTSINDTLNAGYKLEIEFDKCNVTSKYKQSTTVLILGDDFQSTDVNEKFFPSKGDFKFTAKLKRNGKTLFKKTYSIQSDLPYYGNNSFDIDELRTAYLNNMGMTMSQTTKKCIEQLVTDINLVVQSTVDMSLPKPDYSRNKIIIMP